MTLFSLGGHHFVLRYLSEADVERYRAFFEGLSDESVRCRFGHLLAALPDATVRQRVAGNTHTEKAIAILDERETQIVAIGRCFLDHETRVAEVALIVAETKRGIGLGRFLLARLLKIARNEGSRSACAFITTRNAPVIRLLETEGFRRQSTDDGTDAKLVLTL